MPDPLDEPITLTRAPTARMAPAVTVVPAPLPTMPPVKESIPLIALRGIVRRWRLAIGLGIVMAAGIGTAVWFLLPPPVPTASVKLYLPLKVLGTIGEHPDPPLERQTQAELIRSHFVLNAAIRPKEIAELPVLKMQDDPVDWLVKNLTVEFLGPEILRISMSYQDPEQARKLVDAVKDSYLENIANSTSSDRATKLRRLNELAATQRTILSRKRDTIRELAKDSGLFDTERRIFIQQTLQFQMQEARRQLTKVEGELRAGKIREEASSASLPIDLPDALLDRNVDSDSRVKLSAQELKDLQELHEAARNAAKRPDQKEVKDAEAKLIAHKKTHEELRVRVRNEARDQVITQTKADRVARLQLIKNENSLVEQQAVQLRGELDAYAKTLSDNRAVGNDIAPIQFEIKQTEELLAVILKSITVLTVEQDAQPRVKPLENAVVARVDEAKRKTMLAGAGAAAGFGIVVALVGLVEFLMRRVDSADTISRGLGLRIVGTVPRPRAFRWWSGRGGIEDLSESIACTRTMLMHGEGLSDYRVLLISSPVSGEGKTTVSVQLAVSVALAGRRTLLIDGDLRNPSVHERLAMQNQAGLCEVLRDEAPVFDVFRETSVPGLTLITAGRWSSDIPQALVSNRLSHAFAVWKDQFDFVLIDSSPTLPVTDALLLGRHADGVIISLLQGVSRLSQATEAVNRFASLGIRVLGAIVNGTSRRTYGGSEKYYYGTPTVESAPVAPEQS